METKIISEVGLLQETRDKTLTVLLTMDEHPEEVVSSSMRWTIPSNLTERFKAYVAAELALQTAKEKAARPRYDLAAARDEMFFSNVRNFLTDGQFGKESAQKLLKQLFAQQKSREAVFESTKAADFAQHQAEWTNILVCQAALKHLAAQFFGSEYSL